MRIIKALSYSCQGLKAAFKTEAAFRQEILLSLVLAPIAVCLDITSLAKLFLISSLFLVIIAELVNTAIEAVVDRISSEKHPLSKKAKDVGSAIVMVALIYAIVVWLVILVDYFSG